MLTSEEESESLQKLIHNSMKDEVIEDLRCDKCETVAKEVL